MSLDSLTLNAALSAVMDVDDPNFVGYPTTNIEVATNWCTAYNTYAVMATDVSNDNLLFANLPIMIETLANQLPVANISATPALAALAYENAFISYWINATFNIISTISPPPYVPPCPNINLGNGIWGIEVNSQVVSVTAGILAADLTEIFSVPSINTQSKIDDITNALHKATTTAVFVLISGFDTTPTGSLPISNLCTLF